MNAQERIGKLQGLLERIQRNAGKTRSHGAQVAAAIPYTAPPAPPAYAAPPTAAAPSYAAPPAPGTYDAVDELLGVSGQPSQPPLDVEVSLESFAPPPATAAPFPSDAPDAEPIPLVAGSSSQAGAPPLDEAFALESEVSEVRITTGIREPAVEVTVAAIEAEAESIDTLGPEELSEDDLVEVMEATPAPAQVTSDVDIDFEEEQPPASSQRKVATSMDEALAAAAEQMEADREVPLKTPPPESGPQEAPPSTSFAAPAAPNVDALLGGELDIPTREAAQAPPIPTQEQLGQTIDLDEARGPSLELAEHQSDLRTPPAVEELEVALPGREVSGGYDDDLEPPPGARDDLEAHRRRLEDDIPPPPESLAQLPSVAPGPAPAEIVPLAAAPAEAAGPEIVARPTPYGSPEGFTSVREAFRPRSFTELLDASLSLNGS